MNWRALNRWLLLPPILAGVGSIVAALILVLDARLGRPLQVSDLFYGALIGGLLGLAYAAVATVRLRSRGALLKAATNRKAVLSLTPFQFEQLVAHYFRSRGLAVTENNRIGADGGIDMRVKGPDGRRTAIQCKKWRRDLIKRDQVASFYGSAAKGGFRRSYYVTTTDYTDEAKRFASETPSSHRLTLVNGDDLMKALQRSRAAQSVPRLPAWAQSASRGVDARLERFSATLGNAHPAVTVVVAAVLATAGWFIAGRFAALPRAATAAFYGAIGLSLGGVARYLQHRGRRLFAETDSLDALRRLTLYRFRLLVETACRGQGYLAWPAKGPDGSDSVLELRHRASGRRALLLCCHAETGTRVTPESVSQLARLGAARGVSDLLLVTAGVVTRDALQAARQADIDLIAGRDLQAFLDSRRRPEADAQSPSPSLP